MGTLSRIKEVELIAVANIITHVAKCTALIFTAEAQRAQSLFGFMFSAETPENIRSSSLGE